MTSGAARAQFAEAIKQAMIEFLKMKSGSFNCYNNYEQFQELCRDGGAIIAMCATPESAAAFLGVLAKPAGAMGKALAMIVARAPGGTKLLAGMSATGKVIGNGGKIVGKVVSKIPGKAKAPFKWVGSGFKVVNGVRRWVGRPLSKPAEIAALNAAKSNRYRNMLAAAYRASRVQRDTTRAMGIAKTAGAAGGAAATAAAVAEGAAAPKPFKQALDAKVTLTNKALPAPSKPVGARVTSASGEPMSGSPVEPLKVNGNVTVKTSVDTDSITVAAGKPAAAPSGPLAHQLEPSSLKITPKKVTLNGQPVTSSASAPKGLPIEGTNPPSGRFGKPSLKSSPPTVKVNRPELKVEPVASNGPTVKPPSAEVGSSPEITAAKARLEKFDRDIVSANLNYEDSQEVFGSTSNSKIHNRARAMHQKVDELEAAGQLSPEEARGHHHSISLGENAATKTKLRDWPRGKAKIAGVPTEEEPLLLTDKVDPKTGRFGNGQDPATMTQAQRDAAVHQDKVANALISAFEEPAPNVPTTAPTSALAPVPYEVRQAQAAVENFNTKIRDITKYSKRPKVDAQKAFDAKKPADIRLKADGMHNKVDELRASNQITEPLAAKFHSNIAIGEKYATGAKAIRDWPTSGAASVEPVPVSAKAEPASKTVAEPPPVESSQQASAPLIENTNLASTAQPAPASAPSAKAALTQARGLKRVALAIGVSNAAEKAEGDSEKALVEGVPTLTDVRTPDGKTAPSNVDARPDLHTGATFVTTFGDGTSAKQEIQKISGQSKPLQSVYTQMRAQKTKGLAGQEREVGDFVVEFKDGHTQTIMHTSTQAGSIDATSIEADFAKPSSAFTKPQIDAIKFIHYVHAHPSPEVAAKRLGLKESSQMLSQKDVRGIDAMAPQLRKFFSRPDLPVDGVVLPTCKTCGDVYFRYVPSSK
jgi:hypothetical protein